VIAVFKELRLFILKVDDFFEIRLLEEKDADKLFKLMDKNREYLKEWLPWLDDNNTVDDSRIFIRQSLEKFANNRGLVAGIWLNDLLTGVIGFNDIDWLKRVATIGYWLGGEFQGKGLMTKSCRALTKYAFDELKMNRVEIHCATGNKKSRAIPERLGFKKAMIVQQAEWLYDHFVDHVVYTINISQWRKLLDTEKGKI